MGHGDQAGATDVCWQSSQRRYTTGKLSDRPMIRAAARPHLGHTSRSAELFCPGARPDGFRDDPEPFLPLRAGIGISEIFTLVKEVRGSSGRLRFREDAQVYTFSTGRS
jgi:hypothetical protein